MQPKTASTSPSELIQRVDVAARRAEAALCRSSRVVTSWSVSTTLHFAKQQNRRGPRRPQLHALPSRA